MAPHVRISAYSCRQSSPPHSDLPTGIAAVGHYSRPQRIATKGVMSQRGVMGQQAHCRPAMGHPQQYYRVRVAARGGQQAEAGRGGRRFVGTHRGFVGTHRGFVGTYRGFVGTYRGFVGTHRGFVGTYRGFDSKMDDVGPRSPAALRSGWSASPPSLTTTGRRLLSSSGRPPAGRRR